MKVVCDSCQAKYQVPDERVAGKKLKIRCKRCGATVLIRGDLVAHTAHAGHADASAATDGSPGPFGGDATFGTGGAHDAHDVHDAHDAHDRASVEGVEAIERVSTPHEAISLGEVDRSSQPDPSDYEWHVSLDGDTQGPFSTAALREWLKTTPGGWDAHVWREGFPDWLDARACAELGPAPAAPALASLQEDEVPTQTFSADSFEGAQFMADLAAPRAAAPRSRISSDMLEAESRAHATAFGGQQSAGYGGIGYSSVSVGAGAAGTAMGSARPAATAGATYTPGPNPGFASGEASGLIDIRALASLARQSTTQIAKGADATGATKRGAGGKGPSQRPDSGLSFGNDEQARVAMANQPSGFGRFDSLAPVSNTIGSNAALPLAILGGCALVAAAVLAAVLFNKGKPSSSDVVATPAPTEQVGQQQSASAATAMPPQEIPGQQASEDPDTEQAAPERDSEDEPVVAPTSAEEEAQAEDESAQEADELAKSKRPRAAQGSTDNEKEAPPANVNVNDSDKAKPKKEDKPAPQESSDVMLAEHAKPVKQAPQLTVTPLSGTDEAKSADSAKSVSADNDALLTAKPAKSSASSTRSIDDLLNGATAEKSATAAASTPNPAAASTSSAAAAPEGQELPEAPSRDETLAAMRGVEAAVRACGENETVTGTAEVAINVAGATGRVTSATVTGITGTVGSCIARAVRNARFPRFTRQTFSIKYPYRF